MAQKNWQKIKLVKLVKLLRQESDEQHPLTTNQICDYMIRNDIPCDRRVVSHDIALLNDIGIVRKRLFEISMISGVSLTVVPEKEKL